MKENIPYHVPAQGKDRPSKSAANRLPWRPAN